MLYYSFSRSFYVVLRLFHVKNVFHNISILFHVIDKIIVCWDDLLVNLFRVSPSRKPFSNLVELEISSQL